MSSEPVTISVKAAEELFGIPVGTLYSWWKRGMLLGEYSRDLDTDRRHLMLDSNSLVEYLARRNYRPCEGGSSPPAPMLAPPVLESGVRMGIREAARYFSAYTGWNIRPGLVSQWASTGAIEVVERTIGGMVMVNPTSLWEYLTTAYRPKPRRYEMDNTRKKDEA